MEKMETNISAVNGFITQCKSLLKNRNKEIAQGVSEPAGI